MGLLGNSEKAKAKKKAKARAARAKLKKIAREKAAKVKNRKPRIVEVAESLKKQFGLDDPFAAKPFQTTVAIERADSISECRMCLEPGIERGCCGNFFCNACFYQYQTCPSCDTKIDRSDAGTKLPPATRGMVTCATLGVLIVTCLFFGLPIWTVYWESIIPGTVWGFKCGGFFDQDYQWLCYNRVDAFDTENLTRVSSWGRCDSNSSELGCVCGHACTSNRCTYQRSTGQLGLDWMTEPFYAAEIVMHEHFADGVPTGSFWGNMSGIVMSKSCGTVKGGLALRFRGGDARFANTVDFNLEHGGQIEFHMAYGMGQVGCASLENGWVTLAYSTNGGGNWTDLATYPRNVYRVANFTRVRETLPAAAASSTTRFRWYQKEFWPLFDVFALDEIKVFANLPSNWSSTPEYHQRVANIREREVLDECCLDCNQCEKPHEIAEPELCPLTPGFKELPKQTAMEHEFIVLVVGLVAAARFSLELWAVARRLFLAGMLQCLQPVMQRIYSSPDRSGLDRRASAATTRTRRSSYTTKYAASVGGTVADNGDRDDLTIVTSIRDATDAGAERDDGTSVAPTVATATSRASRRRAARQAAANTKATSTATHQSPSTGHASSVGSEIGTSRTELETARSGTQVVETLEVGSLEDPAFVAMQLSRVLDEEQHQISGVIPAKNDGDGGSSDDSSSSEEELPAEEEVQPVRKVRKVTMKFSSMRGKTWILVYTVLGVGVPAATALVLIGLLTRNTFEQVVVELGVLDYPTLYGFITLVALISDISTVFTIGAYTMGLTPVTRPKFIVQKPKLGAQEDLMQNVRERVMTIMLGAARPPVRVTLNNVRRVRRVDKEEVFMMALTHILASQPIALATLALPETNRWTATGMSVIVACRFAFGPSFLWKAWLVLGEAYSLFTRDRERANRFAASWCGYRCRLAGWLGGWVFGVTMLGGVAGFLFLATISPRAESLQQNLFLAAYVAGPIVLVVGITIGFFLGCTHSLPVHSLMCLTGLSGGVAMQFSYPRRSELFENRAICVGDPKKVAGTGCCVPLRDLCSKMIGINNPNHTHFHLDPKPFQEAVLYAFVKNPKKLMGEIDMDTILDSLRAERKLVEAAAEQGFDLPSDEERDDVEFDDDSEEDVEKVKAKEEEALRRARVRAVEILLKQAEANAPLATGKAIKKVSKESKIVARDMSSLVKLKEQQYADPKGTKWKDPSEDSDKFLRWKLAAELAERTVRVPQAWENTPAQVLMHRREHQAKEDTLLAAQRDHAARQAARPPPAIGERHDEEPFVKGAPGTGPLYPGKRVKPFTRHVNVRRNALR